MNRRKFVTAASTAVGLGVAGCLGGDDGDVPDTDEEHLTELRAEINDRGVEILELELEDGIVDVEHGYEEQPNDAVANVAMAFVERIIDDWDVDRLDGVLHENDGDDWIWYAESEWAEAYADGEIGADEYGQKLRESLSMGSEADE